MQADEIRYLRRYEVNVEKWNACVASASNGLIYPYAFYLDAMTDDWDALVMGDYAFVMPLPRRRKWFIPYLYHPFLTAQLGVFGNGFTKEIFEAFLKAVPRKFWHWDFSLNHGNLFAVEGFKLYQRTNYVLSLQTPYKGLYKNYRENVRRNVKKSISYGCRTTTDVVIDDVIALTKFQSKDMVPKDVQRMKGLFQTLQEKNSAKIYGVVSAKGELLASAVFLFSHKRAYYILVGNHPNGRTLGASHALIDGFIKDYAGQDLSLDFEGSDIRNLAFFYSSFGAVEEKYAAIRQERFPGWLNWRRR